MTYVAKPGTWFDAGTVAELLCMVTPQSALFAGIRDGRADEEVCGLDEFEVTNGDSEHGTVSAVDDASAEG